jgi:hypothetical protein
MILWRRAIDGGPGCEQLQPEFVNLPLEMSTNNVETGLLVLELVGALAVHELEVWVAFLL